MTHSWFQGTLYKCAFHCARAHFITVRMIDRDVGSRHDYPETLMYIPRHTPFEFQTTSLAIPKVSIVIAGTEDTFSKRHLWVSRDSHRGNRGPRLPLGIPRYSCISRDTHLLNSKRHLWLSRDERWGLGSRPKKCTGRDWGMGSSTMSPTPRR